MTDSKKNELEKKIEELEFELKQREADLDHYRKEVVSANRQIESLISRIGEDLKLAGIVQRILVPTEFPNIPDFEFSTKFLPGMRSGGDYFDIFEHEDKFRYGIIVASSSGYGVSALLLSVLLKLTGQLEARRGRPPEEIVHLMSQEIVSKMKEGDEASVFYGVVDRRGFELSYCLAGQVVGLLLNYESGELSRLETGSPPISTLSQGSLSQNQVGLNPRDRVIFCTQGLMKAKNSEGEHFGEERLYKAILDAPKKGVHELRNEIIYQMELFTGSKKFDRDTTVVVIEVRDRVIKLAR